MFSGHLRFPVTWGSAFNPVPSTATRPTGQSGPQTHPFYSAYSLLTMFLVLIATEELKEFFAKARAGSVRLIKVVIEDGECPATGAQVEAGPGCFWNGERC